MENNSSDTGLHKEPIVWKMHLQQWLWVWWNLSEKCFPPAVKKSVCSVMKMQKSKTTLTWKKELFNSGQPLVVFYYGIKTSQETVVGVLQRRAEYYTTRFHSHWHLNHSSLQEAFLHIITFIVVSSLLTMSYQIKSTVFHIQHLFLYQSYSRWYWTISNTV